MAEGPIVIVGESDVLVRMALAEYLRSCGYLVVEVATSEEAVAVLGEARLTVDIVLCDAELRGELGGFGLRQWVREHRPDVDVELAGNVAKAADAAAAICEQGPQLARPYEPQTVVDRIKQLRARRERHQNGASAPA